MRWTPAVLAVALGLGSAAWAGPPSSSVELSRLAQAWTAEPPGKVRQEGALGFYGRALLGDALVRRGLLGEVAPGDAAGQVEGLLRQLRGPAYASIFPPGSVAYRAHLVLLEEGRLRLGPASEGQRRRHTDDLEKLAREVQVAPTHLLPSYPSRIYPADNEVLLAALSLAQQRAPAASLEASTRLLRAALLDVETDGLPASELRGARSLGPRGCALAWTVAMRGLYDSRGARQLYDRVRPIFWRQLGPWTAFREWPEGVSGSADPDSGPVFLGVGASATGLAAVAAGAAQRPDDARALLGTVQGGWALLSTLPPGAQVAASGIAAWAQSTGAWTGLPERIGSTR